MRTSFLMENGGQRVIVITGASSGIGRELALQVAAPGCRLWLIARNGDRLAAVAEQARAAGAEAQVVTLDLADTSAANAFLTGSLAAEPRIDELYLVAAVSIFGEVKDTLLDDWTRLYRTNLLSVAQWVTAVYPRMVAQRSGRIVIVSSLAAYMGYPTSTPYATMKSGLLGMYRSLLQEARPHGVSVHLVSPGYVATGIYQAAIYRNTNCDSVLRQVSRMGFKMMPAADAAATMLRAIRRGRPEIVFPGYARLMAWLAPRMPWILKLVHGMVMREFRREAAQ